TPGRRTPRRAGGPAAGRAVRGTRSPGDAARTARCAVHRPVPLGEPPAARREVPEGPRARGRTPPGTVTARAPGAPLTAPLVVPLVVPPVAVPAAGTRRRPGDRAVRRRARRSCCG